MKFVVLAALVAAIVAPAAGGDSDQWSLTGSGVGTGVVAGDHVMIGAHSDVGGANPRGHAEATGAINGVGEVYNLGGDVVCLSVVGNRALAIWQLRRPLVLPGTTPYEWEGAYVEDNGDPGAGVPDRMVDFVLHQPGKDFFCSISAADYPFAALAEPIESGNFVVRD